MILGTLENEIDISLRQDAGRPIASCVAPFRIGRPVRPSALALYRSAVGSGKDSNEKQISTSEEFESPGLFTLSADCQLSM